MSFRSAVYLALVASFFCVGHSAARAAVLTEVGATASSELEESFARGAQYLVDGSGMIGDAHGTVPDGTMWLSVGTSGCCGGFPPPPDASPNVTFDLGSVHTVNSMRVWNYNEINLPTRGTASANIQLAGDDLVFNTVIAGQAFAQAPSAQADFSQVINLGGQQARYVRLANMVAFPASDNGFVGLSEVRFDATAIPNAANPLPATVHQVSSNLFGFNRVAAYSENHSGLVNGTHSISPDGTMWLNQGTIANVPPEQFDTEPFIIYDLGSVVSLDRMKIWNYNEFLPGRDDLLNRGVHFADVLVAGEDLNFGAPLIAGLELDIAPGVNTVDFGQVVPLGGVSARYVALSGLVNFGNFENLVGLSEVQFFAVPEPSSVLLAGLGALALVATCLRRRSRQRV